jgi:predicted DNA-binding transcriptional regulator AlpA
MAEPQTPDRSGGTPGDDRLFTLSEISQRTGISMPTLQRYKKTYQDRIPSHGTGRKQRYPEHALPVFEQLRSENAGKRGRPRKDASAAAAGARSASRGRRGAARRSAGAAARPGRRPAAARTKRAATGVARRGRPPKAAVAARAGRLARGTRVTGRGRRAAGAGTGRPGRPRGTGRATAGRGGRPEGLLTLTQISATTGISYPTLVRYVRLHSDRLPHAGKGRARRFYPEAVEVFRSLRQQSGRGGRRPGPARGRAAAGGARRGRPPKEAATGRLEAVLVQRIRDLERFQQAVEKRFSDLVRGLQKLR